MLYALRTQTWAALRAQGIRTPEVAAWQRVPPPPATLAGSNTTRLAYTYIMNVYNVPAYQQARQPPCPQHLVLCQSHQAPHCPLDDSIHRLDDFVMMPL